MRVHFIAIGGSAMHNLAIAMHLKGYKVSGSDDEIVEPSRGRLQKHGLLPAETGWFPEKLEGVDAVILGMHARNDNPELAKALELGLPVYSYPGYIYEQSRNKKRVVIGGSHGKTTITAMILHVLQTAKVDTDYLVGAQLKGFETMVRITEDAPLIVLEGDEYLSSPIEQVPKFHLYRPHIALLSGIAWDHINVFPTFDNYVDQFRIFINKIEPGGTLVYADNDAHLRELVNEAPENIKLIPYGAHPHRIENGLTILSTGQREVPVRIFGRHNLQNLKGAQLICGELGITDDQFYEAIQSFEGAAKRLELVFKNNHTAIYKDFAHSPSKLKATTEALREQYPNRKLIACMELHTFSSLNSTFLDQYKGSMEKADLAFVYFNPHTVQHKKLAPITDEQVREAFGGNNIYVSQDSGMLLSELRKQEWKDANLLMMSSGNFDGIRFEQLPEILGL